MSEPPPGISTSPASAPSWRPAVRPLTAGGFSIVLIASVLVPFATMPSCDGTPQTVSGLGAAVIGGAVAFGDPLKLGAWILFGTLILALLSAVVGLAFQLNRKRMGTLVGFTCGAVGGIAMFVAVLVLRSQGTQLAAGFYLQTLGFFISAGTAGAGLLVAPRAEEPQGHELPAVGAQPMRADTVVSQTGGVRSIADFVGQDLIWMQPARTKQAFELRAGDEVIGTLAFQRTSLATGAIGESRWTFKREGFWRPQVTVRAPGSDANVAVFKPGWGGGGTLELAPDRQLHFGSANFWHSQWDWQASDGKPLVHFKSHQGLLKVEGQVDIEADATAIPELPLLVVLGWYLLILFARDAAAGGAAAAGAVAATAG